MPDVRIFIRNDDTEINVTGGDVELDNGLTTAVVLSLLTQTSEDFTAGYWGDSINADNSVTGSRIFSVRKNTQEGRAKIVEYAKESLEWMKDNGVVDTITAEIIGFSAQRLDILVTLKEPEQTETTFRYEQNWRLEQQRVERG